VNDVALGPHTSTVDRYLETIYYIAAEGDVVRPGHLSAWLGVSAPTVSEALRRLERDGWIATAKDRSVTLTATGERVAASIVRRHRVLERWLTDVLHFDWAAADIEAERIAVSVSDEVIDRIDVSMGAPTTCPHGNAIPGRTPAYGTLVAIGDLAPGVPARVRRISEVGEHEGPLLLQLLAGHGIGEDCPVVVVAHADAGSVSVRARDVEVELPASAVGTIWVELEAAGATN
jgi:DtxR family transcriptional regulator, Mn-dependent transcriptional regulator